MSKRRTQGGLKPGDKVVICRPIDEGKAKTVKVIETFSSQFSYQDGGSYDMAFYKDIERRL